MAKRAGLPWDCILSAEVFRAYKPSPATYLGVAKVFELPPERVMLVAPASSIFLQNTVVNRQRP